MTLLISLSNLISQNWELVKASTCTEYLYSICATDCEPKGYCVDNVNIEGVYFIVYQEWMIFNWRYLNASFFVVLL